MITVVLDGYNVVHAIPALARELDQSLEAARVALVGLCRDYRARRGDVARLYVVFDGSGTQADVLPANRGGVTVVFTQRGEEADERILSLVREDGGRSRFVIVSNDTHIANNARGLGARVIPVQTFYRQARPARSARSKPPAADDTLKLSPREAQQITEEYRKHLKDRP
ncbi:MAG: NYN domain-containing protein [Candidatus Omnitrophica bacterium]|nr:NYN domain-containing protein [Candidatus Omnitrophota bacterium]